MELHHFFLGSSVWFLWSKLEQQTLQTPPDIDIVYTPIKGCEWDEDVGASSDGLGRSSNYPCHLYTSKWYRTIIYCRRNMQSFQSWTFLLLKRKKWVERTLNREGNSWPHNLLPLWNHSDNSESIFKQTRRHPNSFNIIFIIKPWVDYTPWRRHPDVCSCFHLEKGTNSLRKHKSIEEIPTFSHKGDL